MKKRILILFLLIFTITLVSCKKEDDKEEEMKILVLALLSNFLISSCLDKKLAIGAKHSFSSIERVLDDDKVIGRTENDEVVCYILWGYSRADGISCLKK